MSKQVNPIPLPALLAPLLTACVGTTGSGIVDFAAYASGPADASGAPGATHAYVFESPYTGYTITLHTATLQIGAIYLDATPCTGGSDVPPCVDQSAATVAQVTGGVASGSGTQTSGLLLDVLSPDRQPFSSPGSGIVQQARSAEVWLSSGAEVMAIDDLNATSLIAEVAGSAEKDGRTYPFTGTVTIGQNRLLPASNPAEPGLNPICDKRIVRPICLPSNPPVEPQPGVSLHVQVDPRSWFDNVEFSRLTGPSYQIPDDNDDVNGHNFFQGIETISGVYSFTFQKP
jgi:hypothetical protein